jgi:hypothetical protein
MLRLAESDDGPTIATAHVLPDLNGAAGKNPNSFEFNNLKPGPYVLRLPVDSVQEFDWKTFLLGDTQRAVTVNPGGVTAWKWSPLACPGSEAPPQLSDDDMAHAIRVALVADRGDDSWNADESKRVAQDYYFMGTNIPAAWTRALPDNARVVSDTHLKIAASRSPDESVPYTWADANILGDCASVWIRRDTFFKNPPKAYLGGSGKKYHLKRNGKFWEYDIVSFVMS